MSTDLALVLLATLGIVLANVVGLYAGYNRGTWLETLAYRSAFVGLASLLGLFVALVDAFSQIWVMRAGYEGWPVWGSLAGMIAGTACAFVAGLAVIARENRWIRR